MRPPAVTVIDFETLPIMPRPEYPPKPVGVSIRLPGERRSTYYSWGHPDGNNSTKAEATRRLRDVWRGSGPVLFHNAKFDVDVAQTHMGMGAIPWQRVHDTVFLLFLDDPHAKDNGLKPAAERVLGWAPEEQDRVKEWVVANRASIAAQHGYAFTPKDWGGAIGFAPGALVKPYAEGDTDRTLALFKALWPEVQARSMGPAYDVERELWPILLENERVGMRVDVPALARDVALYERERERADQWLRKRLRRPDLNLDADAEVAEALSANDIIADEDWALTATGKRSVSKKHLRPRMFADPKVASALGYRNRLSTCLAMFMRPWLDQVQRRGDSHISTNWNQVAQDSGGTRTGRPSTYDPNFLNLSKTWHDKDDGYEHPAFAKLIPLPMVRNYILADEGCDLIHRDYNGQELRLLGHYEDGSLQEAYRANPRVDVHEHVKGLILETTGLAYHRHQVKITNFRRIYGGGAPAIAEAMDIPIDAAKRLITAHSAALPGLKGLQDVIKAESAAGRPIVTWGGREYYVEPPGWSARFKRHMTYEYKLLNYLIQGGAADITKGAIIRYHNHPDRRGRFLVTVYDEINASAPSARAKREMRVLKECMEDVQLDVAMLSDGKIGPSWGKLEKYVD